MNFMHKTAFIGHRKIFAEGIYESIVCEAEKLIAQGCLSFTMGTHGQFDALALSACRALREKVGGIQIEVVITGLGAIKKDKILSSFSDVNTVMFDVEEMHYKRRITYANRRMIDGCDALICYVDEKSYSSGAKRAMNYAREKGLRIINLYREEDLPFYGVPTEEIEKLLKSGK